MSLPLGLPARFDGAPRFLRGMSEFLARFYAETRSSFFCGSKCWLSYTISNDIALAESSWGVFWDEIKTTHEVLFDRSFEAVRWRYKDSPNNYEMNFLWRNGRLVGYLVTRVMNHAGRSNLVVADCVCIQGEDVGIHVLARAVIQKALAARITRISAWFVETGDYYNAFLKMGFFDRDVIPVIGYADDFYQMVESRPRKWHFTIGDSDNI